MHAHLILVTGASSGIGRALADTNPFRGARLVGISRGAAPGLEHVAADLADPAGWRVACDAIEREVAGFAGERVVLLHSAGTLEPIGFAGEVDADAYRRNVLLNSACPQVLGDAFLRAAGQTGAACDK